MTRPNWNYDLFSYIMSIYKCCMPRNIYRNTVRVHCYMAPHFEVCSTFLFFIFSFLPPFINKLRDILPRLFSISPSYRLRSSWIVELSTETEFQAHARLDGVPLLWNSNTALKINRSSETVNRFRRPHQSHDSRWAYSVPTCFIKWLIAAIVISYLSASRRYFHFSLLCASLEAHISRSELFLASHYIIYAS